MLPIFVSLDNPSGLANLNNVRSCAAYIAAVKSIGLEIDIKYLISESEAIINGDIKETNKFNENISSLVSFYNKAFKMYKSNFNIL